MSLETPRGKHTHGLHLKDKFSFLFLQYVLQFDGEGSYEFKQIDFSAEDFGS